MKNQKIPGAGGNPKSSSHKPSSSLSSDRKSRWESGTKPPPARDYGPPTDSKPSKPSSNPKDDPTSAPGPSRLPLDAVPPAVPRSLPPPGAGAGASVPFPDHADIGPPPPPSYGFHMLERRTFVLADGNVRSYFALPPDYQDFPPPERQVDPSQRFFRFGPGNHGPERGGLGLGVDKQFPQEGRLSPEGFRRDRDDQYGRGGGGKYDYQNSLGLDGRGPMLPEASLKRKNVDGDERDMRDELARQRQRLLHYGNLNSNPNGDLAGTSSPFRRDQLDFGRGLDDLRSRRGAPGDDAGLKRPDVDPIALKKAFLRFTKLLNENASERNKYFDDGKNGLLQCLACGRDSTFYQDMHDLIMHTYNSQNADLLVDHLGLHKSLCVLMGWNYSKPPENSKAYQLFPADEADANRDDLIMWPPVVIIHNTNSGKGKDGRMDGMGNKVMDSKLRDLGFGGGKARSLYGKEGHMGITLVKFASDQSGLREATRLAEFFEKDNHGRKGWARAQSSQSGKDDETNPNLVKLDEKTGEKKRIFYGYLGTAFDLDKVDFESRKRAAIESQREFKPSN